MQSLTETLLKAQAPTIFSDEEVGQVLQFPSAARRYALVKRALAHQEIVRIHRGLYALGPVFRRPSPDLFVVAGRICRSSYISLESALAEHGLIPERVMVTTSGTFGRSSCASTPLGRFEFRHTPFRALVAVHRVERNQGEAFLLASPLRALADLAHDRSSVQMDLKYLVESLRLEREWLQTLTTQEFAALEQALPEGRARHFLQRLREELGQ